MGTRGRVWGVGKWAGVAATVAILTVWVATVPIWPNRYHLALGIGTPFTTTWIVRGHIQTTKSPREGGRYWRRYEWKPFGYSVTGQSFGWFWPEVYHNAGMGRTIVFLPLWIPLLLVGVPTAFVWFSGRGRAAPPGYCPKCGYDLTKNESGICPECGVEIERVVATGAEKSSAAPPGRDE